MSTQRHGHKRGEQPHGDSVRPRLGEISSNVRHPSRGPKGDKSPHKVTNGKVAKGSSPSSLALTSSSTSSQHQRVKDASHYRLHFSGELISGRSPLAGSNMSSSVHPNTQTVLKAISTNIVLTTKAKIGHEEVRARIITEYGYVNLHQSKVANAVAESVPAKETFHPSNDKSMDYYSFPMELGDGDEKIKISNPQQDVLVTDLQALDGRNGFSAVLGLGPGDTPGLPLFDTILAQEGRAEAYRHNTLTMDISPRKPKEGSKTDFEFDGYFDIGVVNPKDPSIQWIKPSFRKNLRDSHSAIALFDYGNEVLGDPSRPAHGLIELGSSVTIVQGWLFDALKAKLQNDGINIDPMQNEIKFESLRLNGEDREILKGKKRFLNVRLLLKDVEKYYPVSSDLATPLHQAITVQLHKGGALERINCDFKLGLSFFQAAHRAGKQIVFHNPSGTDEDIQPCAGLMPRTERSRREEVTQTGSVTGGKRQRGEHEQEEDQKPKPKRPWDV